MEFTDEELELLRSIVKTEILTNKETMKLVDDEEDLSVLRIDTQTLESILKKLK